MKEDVFCDECKNLRLKGKKIWCEVPGKKTYMSRAAIIKARPEIKNASNKCEDYEERV